MATEGDKILTTKESLEAIVGTTSKKANQRQLEEITNKVNKVIDKKTTRTITETNNLINAASIYVAKKLGLKQNTEKQSKIPWWQRRIERDIKRIRKDINMLERIKRGELRKRGKMEQQKRNTISGRREQLW